MFTVISDHRLVQKNKTLNAQILNAGKSKEAKKKKKKDHDSSNDAKSKESGPHEEDVYLISSGDEDSSKGMKSMNFLKPFYHITF